MFRRAFLAVFSPWLTKLAFAIASIVVLAAIAGAGIYLLRHSETPPPIQGIVHATELRVAPEVGGHLAAIYVRKGDRVKRGDMLAELSAAELNASVEQARAAYQSALADREQRLRRHEKRRDRDIGGGNRQGEIPPDLCRTAIDPLLIAW